VDVRVAGHQVDTGESLREHAQQRVAEITEKYFSRSVGANVTFGRGPNNDFTWKQDSEQADFPAIVAETRVDIPQASVSDAVMLMDLRNTPALMFKNSGTGEFNMIYRREDGNIGWVEPQAD
jgi:ribosome-associated translation inhibitor RaiA